MSNLGRFGVLSLKSPEPAKTSSDPRLRGLIPLCVCGLIFGCNTPITPPPPVKPLKPLSVHRADKPMRVFSAEEEIPSSTYTFQGAQGSVRVTMEIEGTSPSTVPTPPVLNDVLFHAVGDGIVSVTFKRPWPGHDNGQVTIRCLSGEEESTASFEPELWFHQPAAIVTFESPVGEPSNPAVEGKEIVLARYVARNIPKDVRLTFKATFTRQPITPRIRAGLKPET